MRLPGGDNVEIDERKLVDYALSPTHPVGKHKARLFKVKLGIDAGGASALVAALIEAAAGELAVAGDEDFWGRRYRIDFLFRFGGRSAIIASGWIVPSDGSRTRLTSVFIPRGSDD